MKQRDEWEIEAQGTEHGYKKLIESSEWADILRVLAKMEKACIEEYRVTADMMQVGTINGRLEAIEYIRDIPNVLLGELTSMTNNSSKGE